MEGFNYEEGYKHKLNVKKKVIEANPYQRKPLNKLLNGYLQLNLMGNFKI
ncbi:hypothetical protein ACFFU9_07685 [Mariniflexile ostreae]|uniref:Uncharacterized protein n=1 Tax=Mariniflexile ostreae TaxID=1520892 RepID=A0ABV5FAZ8_9FLAO